MIKLMPLRSKGIPESRMGFELIDYKKGVPEQVLLFYAYVSF
jgi:hypothetical protein